ncbi:MAG: SDR family oxidoreductase [Candidatus Anstonellales archaeon]
MKKLLEGKVAIVTGGGSGIGRAASLGLAREGAKVVVADINVKGGNETVTLIHEQGGEGFFVKTDVTQAVEVENMVQKTVTIFGRLDCAFNNAGITGTLAPIAEQGEENWQAVMEVNLKGVWLCMKYEIPQMIKQRQGSIVNMASIVSLVGFRSLSVYCASKCGVVGLTKAAALEYADAGIRINALSPGAIRTPITETTFQFDPKFESHLISLEPMGRMGTPDEIAGAVIWLCSDKASFITGHNLIVDGGMTVY